MLTIRRSKGESIIMGYQDEFLENKYSICIHVSDITKGTVHLKIKAPSYISIWRTELLSEPFFYKGEFNGE